MQAGHALAAAAEGVGIHHMAVFLVLLLPGAYVALDTDTLTILIPLRSLRVNFSSFGLVASLLFAIERQ